MAALIRVPNRLIKQLAKERGLSFVVGITAHMAGEMKNPASILVKSEKLDSSTRELLTEKGCKEVRWQ